MPGSAARSEAGAGAPRCAAAVRRRLRRCAAVARTAGLAGLLLALVLGPAVAACPWPVRRRGLCGAEAGPSKGRERVALAAAAAPVMIGSRSEALHVLGLDSDTTPAVEEIKRAFKREVLKAHPDREGGSPERFMLVLDAYAVLTGVPREGSAATASAGKGTKRYGGPRADLWSDDSGREDIYKREGHWRWSQDGGFNPVDLDNNVWAELGIDYNPYTGEYIKPREPRSKQAARDAEAAAAEAAGKSKGSWRWDSAAERSAKQHAAVAGANQARAAWAAKVGRQEAQEGEGGVGVMAMLEMSIYLLLIVVCLGKSYEISAGVSERRAVGGVYCVVASNGAAQCVQD